MDMKQDFLKSKIYHFIFYRHAIESLVAEFNNHKNSVYGRVLSFYENSF